MRISRMFWVGVAVLGTGAAAQTAATGDARTVTEPVIPATCTVLQAQQAIVAGEPASETTLDTVRVQAAMTGCTVGQAVELTSNGANNAFVTGPLTIPTGVTLLVDGGVTLFGSRNPADYQVTTAGVETCGTVGTAGNGCQPLILSSGSNSAVMGYGVIDGRGEDKLLVGGVPQTYSWWDNAGTAQLRSGAQNNPILMSASGANLILYKITVKNSAMFHIKWSGNLTTKTGFTAWGVKVITPFSARNSDGIDPSGLNISVLNSSISDGDDNVAVSASNAAQNITVQNVNTYSGHGISIGSGTKGGLNNMLVDHITQMGTAADGNGIGIRIKAQQSNGGLVQNVTYQNICSANNRVGIYLGPYYSTTAGTSYPSFQNIIYRNIHIITEPLLTIEGYQNTAGTVVNPSTITLDNVIIDTLAQKDFSPAEQNLAVTLGPGPVTPLLTTQTGTNITYTGSVTLPTEAPYPCSLSNFQYLVGELYTSTAAATSLKTETLNAPTSVTLNAMLQPAMSQVSYTSNASGGSYTGTAAPTAAVTFMEGPAVVGTGTLGGNGTLASATLTGVRPGPHTYTAFYAGDTTYTTPYAFGSVSVTVIGVPSTTTVTATGTLVYGAATAVTATVSGSGGTPTGQVQFMDGGVNLGAPQTLAGGVATLMGTLAAGMHTLTAAYLGDTTFSTSTGVMAGAGTITVAQAVPVTTVTASPGTINPGGTTTLSVTVGAVGGGMVPTGSVTVFNAGFNVGAAPLDGTGKASIPVMLLGTGTNTLTVTYSGNANYAASSGTAAVLVAGQFTLTLAGSMTSLAAGAMSTTGVTVTPGGPYSGTVALTCASPVYYVTCVVAPGTLTLSSGVAGTAAVTISVAATVSAVPAEKSVAWLAMLLPLGLLGLARRREGWGKGLLLAMLMGIAVAGVTGCGSSSAAAPKLPAAGTQVVTVTAAAGGVVSSAAITVTITN